ncbi:MAG: Ig-like domain-containing protein [Clostridia bacterium]|nr:Ig-like domain-containing protein [Clostridia bacterium]
MKKFLSLLIILIMTFTMMPLGAFATQTSSTSYVILKASTAGSNGIKLSWNKTQGATKYVIYGGRCGKTFHKIATTSKSYYTVKKIAGKKLTSHKSYRFYVKAYKNGKKLAISKHIHFIVNKTMGKSANATKVTAKYSKKTLTVGKTCKLSATVKVYKNKRHIASNHGAKLKFTSTNPNVASVSTKGLVKGKKAGTAKIYIQDISGIYAITTVKVNPVKMCTVSFDAQNVEDDPASITVPYGSKISKPASSSVDKWYKEAACINQWNFKKDVVTKDITLYAEPACLAGNTMISMANGGKKAVQDIRIGDDIVVFDHNSGTRTTAKVFDFYKYEEKRAGAFTLHFSNDVDVTIVGSHKFFEKDANKYVTINRDNVQNYIGSSFFNLDTMNWESLQDVTFIKEKVDTFIVASEKHINCAANGMLTGEDGVYGWFYNIFQLDENMKIKEKEKLADIEDWGLFTFEETGYVSPEAFEAFNMKYLNVAKGKGIVTAEQLKAAGINATKYDTDNVR